MRITMIGCGYVGLVSGACLADFGHQVTAVDHDHDKIAALRQGKIPIYEPGLDALVASNVKAGRLSFLDNPNEVVADSDVIFVGVGTPSRRGDGFADLSYVYEAAKELAPHLKGFTVVAIKSTVPVGTGDEVELLIRETNTAADVAVVSNPEFLREGAAINDFKHPDRIVIGVGDDPRAREAMTAVYRPLYLNQAPLLFTSRRASELIKYAANAFLAMKITYINEIADLCEKVGADVKEVARGIGLDNRIGPKFLNAGPGYGGSCFPKDTIALAKTAQDFESPIRLVETTIAVNDQRKRAMARKIIALSNGDVRGKTIAILGLTFKPNTDDMREAPSLYIIQALQDAGAKIRAFDPVGMEIAKGMMKNVDLVDDPYRAAEGAHALAIVTEWEMFRALDLGRLKKIMKEPVLVDLRNIYSTGELRKYGFRYASVGSKTFVSEDAAELAFVTN